MKTGIYTLSALAIATSLAMAQEPPKGPDGPKRERPTPEAIFKKLDTNNDGELSLDEFKAGPRGQKDPAKAEEIFKKIDTNGDGKVTLEEFKAHRPPHRPGAPGGPGGPDMPPPPGGAAPPPPPPAK
jgi:hypothetical protein